MDFFKITERSKKQGEIDIYPEFLVRKSSDLMIRGGAFYAIWDAEKGLWSTDEYDVQRLVDDELWKYYEEFKKTRSFEGRVNLNTMLMFSSRTWAEFKKYTGSLSDSRHTLDERLTFANTEVKKNDYRSKRLPYNLAEGDYSAWDELVGTLYEPKEREKLEWAIGAIVSGDSRDIQKFIVLYGDPGSGKGTVLEIIMRLFDGYYSTFNAKQLTSSNNQFATEVFRTDPLVSIQTEGDLSKIEDNTMLNAIVSHEKMTMNEKYKSSYDARVNAFLFMATNKPVKITDAKSGIIRRLIDVSPAGKKIPTKRYFALMGQVNFELGAIAQHCLDVYRKLGRDYYEGYKPYIMMLKTNAFYNFVEAYFEQFRRSNEVCLTDAFEMYNVYCEKANIDRDHRLVRHVFREELKNYFSEFLDITRVNGRQIRSYYRGFRTDKFATVDISEEPATVEELIDKSWLQMTHTESLLDILLADRPAQLADEEEKPLQAWSGVLTKLKDIDTKKLHYVRPPKQMIVIDFDIKDENGKKSKEKNLEAAEKWPKTYAEFSKGGGLHLHYIYDGDVTKLTRVHDKDIEVKVFTGRSSLRRKLSHCNDIPVATLPAGSLKEKAVKNDVIDKVAVDNERHLRKRIEDCLNKSHHGATAPEINYIFDSLQYAYDNGIQYDLTNMRELVRDFAQNSRHQSDYCLKKYTEMKFRSKDLPEAVPDDLSKPMIFFDVETMPGRFGFCWKFAGSDKIVVAVKEPTPADVRNFIDSGLLIGFNNRRYDNHMLYARAYDTDNYGMDYDSLYLLSNRIVSGASGVLYGNAFNLSYSDVYDFCSKKQGLKKWEIELGLFHLENPYRWDQPVTDEQWDEIMEYCKNDVLATEAVFNARQADWTARLILANVAGMTPNDTTNMLTTRIIFDKDKRPQAQFNYRFMGTKEGEVETYRIYPDGDPGYSVFDSMNRPVFPGYVYDAGKSTYRGEEVGEGGYVYAEPGMYRNVALLDIASMHPSSIVAENLFGDIYTKRFKELLDARIAIKHKDFEKAKTLLDGKLAPFLTDESAAKDLSQALKIAINSVYGLTAASFDNPFRDRRNVDNIVAKRGALFMVNLKHEVQRRGFTVAHIKTDSIKIPDATPEIIRFVMDYGEAYGYTFEHEATYDRMCLVNDAVYIARYSDGTWTATGAQFQHPYVFKTLFSKEQITFRDLCETKSVTGALYLDINEDLPDVSDLEKKLAKLMKDSDYDRAEADELKELISKGHAYRFVGRVGQFCPIQPCCDGGLLLREKDGKYYAVTGTKGYRWLEAQTVKALGKEGEIDMGYFNALVDAAVENISQYCDFEEFVSG